MENRHEPTTIHLKTYVEDRYKLTVYFEQTYGELFDLEEDPAELNNLWDSPSHEGLKNRLIQRLLFPQKWVKNSRGCLEFPLNGCLGAEIRVDRWAYLTLCVRLTPKKRGYLHEDSQQGITGRIGAKSAAALVRQGHQVRGWFGLGTLAPKT